jgi:hypothetical protein
MLRTSHVASPSSGLLSERYIFNIRAMDRAKRLCSEFKNEIYKPQGLICKYQIKTQMNV